ncbi:M23 family metallopeptidase [Phenylobacterium aquaticum]|uniref:M23 family metallopeptidase n=1 Tax=Phenylobacterium aquaticum TaxID=1763816 RepID=UPI0026E957B2|nr:M23 family metallopeptidase [Phenylobacterium aquaticum]
MRAGAWLLAAGLAGTLTALPASADAPAQAHLVAASIPTASPVPMAPSVARTRFWPVVTALPQATLVPAILADGEVQGSPDRTFDSRRPSDPSKPQTRRHVGVDLTAAEGDTVVAMEPGKIVAFYPFLARDPADGGEQTWAILVAHRDYVALYGEVRASSLSDHHLAVGETLAAGQPIATVSGTAQLHTEIYPAGVTRNYKWPVGEAPPPQMRNPTQFLLDTAANGLRIYPGLGQSTVTAAP